MVKKIDIVCILCISCETRVQRYLNFSRTNPSRGRRHFRAYREAFNELAKPPNFSKLIEWKFGGIPLLCNME